VVEWVLNNENKYSAKTLRREEKTLRLCALAVKKKNRINKKYKTIRVIAQNA